MTFIAMEMREIMAELGFRTIDEMVGHVECLDTTEATEHWKAKGVDLTTIFHKPDVGEEVGGYLPEGAGPRPREVARQHDLLKLCKPAIERGEKVRAELPIINVNRVVGTITGSEITRKHGGKGLPEDTVYLKFNGSAGQSFAAFTPPA
jgi:glutamate synthase domain-containing protein 3